MVNMASLRYRDLTGFLIDSHLQGSDMQAVADAGECLEQLLDWIKKACGPWLSEDAAEAIERARRDADNLQYWALSRQDGRGPVSSEPRVDLQGQPRHPFISP